jgi:hypothetical protein
MGTDLRFEICGDDVRVFKLPYDELGVIIDKLIKSDFDDDVNIVVRVSWIRNSNMCNSKLRQA